MLTLTSIMVLLRNLWTSWSNWLSPPRILAVMEVTEEEKPDRFRAKCRFRTGVGWSQPKGVVFSWRRAPQRTTDFVHYRVGGRDFYWWRTYDDLEFDLPDASHIRTSKIARAKLVLEGTSSTDVTEQVAALAGHNADFHGKWLDPAMLRRFFGMLAEEGLTKKYLPTTNPAYLSRMTLRIVYLPRLRVVDVRLSGGHEPVPVCSA